MIPDLTDPEPTLSQPNCHQSQTHPPPNPHQENTQVVYLESELKDARATSAALVEELAAAHDAVERTMASQPLEQDSFEHTQLLDQIAVLEQELMVAKTQTVDSHLHDNERAAQQIAALGTERDTLSQRVASLETQRNRLQDDLNSHLATIEELRAAKASDERIVLQVKTVDEANPALQEQLNDIKIAKSTADQRISELENQVRTERVELTSLKAQQISVETKSQHDAMRIEELEKAVAKGDEDLLLSTTRVKSLLAEMESSKLQTVITSTSTVTGSSDSEELIALRAQVASLTMAGVHGHVNAVGRSSDHKTDQETTQRLHALSTQVEMLTSKRAEEQTMASLAVQQSESLRAAFIRSRDEMQQELVDATFQIVELTKKLADEQLQRKATQQEAENAKLELVDTGQAMERLQVQLRASTDELASHKTQHNELVSVQTAATEQIKTLNEQLAVGASDKERSDARLSELEGQLEKGGDELAALKLMGEKAGNDEQTLSLQSSLKQANDEIERLKVLLADMTSAKAQADTQLEATNRELVDLQASSSKIIADWETECNRNASELAAITKTHADVTAAMAVAERTIAEWETTCKDKDIEIASLTDQQTNIRTSSAAAINEAVETLKTELSALSTSSSQSVANLQAQLQDANDGRTALVDKHAELIVMNATANKQVEALTAQCKDDTNELAVLKSRVSELEAAMKQNDEQLTAMTKTHADVTAAGATAMAVAEKTIAEWESTCKDKDIEIASLTDQQINIRTSSAAAADEAVETLETELLALQISTSKTISNLQAQNRKSNDDAAAVTQRFNDLTAAKAMVDKKIEALQVLRENDANDLIASSSAKIAGNHHLYAIYHTPNIPSLTPPSHILTHPLTFPFQKKTRRLQPLQSRINNARKKSSVSTSGFLTWKLLLQRSAGKTS